LRWGTEEVPCRDIVAGNQHQWDNQPRQRYAKPGTDGINNPNRFLHNLSLSLWFVVNDTIHSPLITHH